MFCVLIRNIYAQPTTRVGEGFCSEAYEKVEVEWGEVVEFPTLNKSEVEIFYEIFD